MAVRLRKSGPFTVLISGMDTTVIPREVWRTAIGRTAALLQDRVANTFAAQRTAAGALIANSPSYTAAKIRQGYDPRRGHRTNLLQSALRSVASQLYVVIGPDKFGNGRIIMQEGRLNAIVPHSEYYAEKKVRGAGILEIAHSWLAAAAAPLRIIEAEASLALRRAAPFAGRAARIVPAFGITGRVAASIARQARAGLTGAQNRQLDRLLRRVR